MKFEYKFILLYLIIGLLWIFFSDNLVFSLENGNELFHTLQTYKGFFFVIVTGIIFFIILKIHLKKLRTAENEARKNDELKTAFLQNISHEIRTPMNGIVGFSNLIQNNMYDSEKELADFLELITSSSNNLLNTIENIVEISRIESGNVSHFPKKLDINNLLEEIYKEFNKKTTDKQELILEIPDNSSMVSFITDPDKLKKIFSSLLHNAIKFTPEGKITFGYINKSDNIYFYVKDTGIGISSEVQENIFNRFMYADVETADNYGGMGLGLALSKGLVKLLGGEIGVESERGKGSEFHFTIPKTTISSN